jgi:hypothetical protein
MVRGEGRGNIDEGLNTDLDDLDVPLAEWGRRVLHQTIEGTSQKCAGTTSRTSPTDYTNSYARANTIKVNGHFEYDGTGYAKSVACAARITKVAARVGTEIAEINTRASSTLRET